MRIRNCPWVALLVSVFAAGVGAQAQTPTVTGVANNVATSLVNSTISPGEELNILGTNLGDATGVACGSPTGFTTTCGSVTVMVAGKAAGVRNENATVVVIQVPVDAPLGATQLVLTRTTGGQSLVSAPFAVTVAATTPELAINNVNGTAFASCFNMANVQLSPSIPASPGDTVKCIGNGFGVTNPVVPTGTIPPTPLPPVVASVSITIAGKNATNVHATAGAANVIVGYSQVTFTVPQGIPPGNQQLVATVGGVSTISYQFPVVIVGPSISSVTNAGSYIDPSLPNGPIAQGSIFVIKGSSLGPSTISVATNAFQSTSLSGTSLSVTVGGTTVAPPLYYTSAGQIAALMPSNTPTGTGTITGTYNGQAGPAAPIQVVASNLGIFTITSDGQGAGIVTYADYSLVSTIKASNCGGVYTTCGAANPGDVLIIWATGLGPITGTDARGDGLGVNMASLPLTVWLGGVPIKAAYQGRSGCCIGEDQIVFTVPTNVPTGCAVPLSVQINNFISNSVAMPVASGSRSCTPTDPAYTVANVVLAASGSGPLTFGGIDLRRNDNFPGFEDLVKSQFIGFTIPAADQPFFFSYIDAPPLGTCQIFNNPSGGGNAPLNLVASLDVGPQLTVQGPNGSKSASTSGKTTLSSSGNFFAPGTITVSAPGGKDVPAFSASITVPAPPTMTSPPPDTVNQFPVTRSSGLTVSWSGGSPNAYIELDGFSNTDNTSTVGAAFQCLTTAGAGTFTVPPSVLLALPAGNFGGLDFYPTVLPVNLTGSVLTVSGLTFRYDYFAPLAFK